jgi:hypothetical protein
MMTEINWTELILGVMTLLGGCGWVIDRKKHRQEVEGLKADNRQKDMELSKEYVTEFRTYIAEPLQREVGELRQEVKELRNAIQRIDRCPHRDKCPVYERMRDEQGCDE